MQDLVIHYDHFIMNAIVQLEKLKNRTIITYQEVQWLKERIIEKAIRMGYHVSVVDSYDIETFKTYIDEVYYEDTLLYRLKPQYDISALKEQSSLWYHLTIAKLFADKDLFLGFYSNEQTSKMYEQAFQCIDEKSELKVLYELFLLEKRKRELKQQLKNMKQNGYSNVEEKYVQSLLMEDPYMSCDKLISDYSMVNGK